MIVLELLELVDLAQEMLIVELRCGRVTRLTAPEPTAVAVLIRRRDLLFDTMLADPLCRSRETRPTAPADFLPANRSAKRRPNTRGRTDSRTHIHRIRWRHRGAFHVRGEDPYTVLKEEEKVRTE